MSLKGKVAFVTGGNSGIGRAISLGLAKAGASIAIGYVAHPEATEELERQIAALGSVAIGSEPISAAWRKSGRWSIPRWRSSAASTS